MAHAGMTAGCARGEVASAPSPPLAAGVDRALPWDAGRDPGGAAGRRRDRHPVCRRGGALRAAPAADLVGRAGLDPVPLARHAGRRGRIPPRRAHAHDGGRRERQARHARLSRSGRDRSRAGVPGADRLAGLRIRLRGELHHHAGAADPQCLARRGAAGRHRPDGAVCVPAAGSRRATSAHRAGGDPVGRAGHRGVLAAQRRR